MWPGTEGPLSPACEEGMLPASAHPQPASPALRHQLLRKVLSVLVSALSWLPSFLGLE